jgi:galactokinase
MSQERKNKIYRAAVPGRVNLIGEWIDFNGGTVLPMALKRSVRLEMRPNNEEKDRVSSAQYEDLAFIDCNAPAQNTGRTMSGEACNMHAPGGGSLAEWT